MEFEHILNVIRQFLDFLGFDLLHPIPQIEAVKRRYGHHRSFIRKIAHSLPIKVPQRIHINIQLISRNDQFQKLQRNVTLAHIGDIGEQSFLNGIKQKSELRNVSNKYFNSSTPNDSFSTSSVNDQVAYQRINNLEDELEKMRAQLAALVVIQENVNSDSDISKSNLAPLSLTSQSQSNIMTVPLPPPLSATSAVCCAGPPPPPPPPPPPLPFSTGERLSVAEIIKQNKTKKGLSVESNTKSQEKKKGVDMSEVLKGIGKVKLNKIARSPGGTPIRASKTESNDPADLIAQALRKKFKNVRFDSPEKSTHSRSPGNFSPTPEKIPIYSRNRLRPVQERRLSNLTNDIHTVQEVM